ncbi:hypothetical protein [Paenibacillus oryzae]|uniref:hypothetical protein n=1 Tax=Paenibacillus oryzae TaxID=1844972 RepID=UPI0012EA8858|nr:hypothetical protein [Paenibacillus oryzae]
MKGIKCTSCNYRKSAGEALIESGLRLLKTLLSSPQTSSLVGANTIANFVEMKCPKCGETGRWVREDE